MLERLPSNQDKWLIEKLAPIQLLSDGPLTDAVSVALIPVGSISPTHLDAFVPARQALGPQRSR